MVVHRQARAQHGLGRLAAFVFLFSVLGSQATADNGVPATIERVKPSIVAVGSFERLRSPQFQFAGTGFIVGDGTLVATNDHVVERPVAVEKGETLAIAIRRSAGIEVRPARRLAADASADLALLKIDGAPLPALFLGKSDAVREGENYLLTGFPIGAVLGLAPVTHRAMIASVSPIAMPALRADKLDARSVRHLASGAYTIFQLDATAYPGSSGSPVYHPHTGEVVGIVNSVFIRGSRESALTNPTGITYAIPAQRLRDLLEAPR